LTLLLGWGLGWLIARSLILSAARDTLYWWISQLDARPHFDRIASLAQRAEALKYEGHPDLRPMWMRRLQLGMGMFANLIGCSACSGFWIGIVLARLGLGLGDTWGRALVTGVCVMGVNALADAWLSAQIARSQR
jgi:hypothetical protein